MTKNIENMSSDDNGKKSSATSRFNKFMQQRRTGKGEPHTHTFFGGPHGSYYIKDDEYDKFLELYSASVKEGKQEHFIVERPKEVGPLCIDIDIDFDPDDKFSNRQYTQKHVKCIIKKINGLLKKYTKVDDNKIKAYVTEKKKPTVDLINGTVDVKRYKDGFHIMYPKISLTTKDRYTFVHMIETKVFASKILEDIPFKNDPTDIFDKRVIKSNGWMMYGSRKATGQLYKLSKIYNSEGKSIKIKDENWCQVLINRGFNEGEEVELKNTDDEFFKQAEKKTGTKITKKIKHRVEKLEKIEEDDDSEVNLDGYDCEDGEDFVENTVSDVEKGKIEKMVEILDPKRAYNYDTWTQVGWCLRNIDKRLLSTFKKFSKESLAKYLKENPKAGKKKYDDKGCEELWKTARTSGSMLTVKSLYHWARTDNYMKYMEISRKYIAKDLVIACTANEYDVAVALHKMYCNQYVCASIQKNKWYEFQGHRWVYIDSAYTLKKKMSTEFVSELSNLQLYLYQEKERVDEANNREDRDHLIDRALSMKDEILKRSERTLKLIDKLKTTTYKENVLRQCALLFIDSEFEEKLDSNRNLLGFNNGVYDLKNDVFRAGTPEDYITFTVGYNYKEFSMKNKYVKAIHEFFDKIQPEKDMKEYMLYLFASHLDGNIKKQRFPIFTGYGGSNGKSASLDLMSLTLGDYASSVPHTLLTRKRGSAGGATPELADKRGIRMVQINEPSKSDEIEVGYMKELTGKDQIQARALYGDMFYFKPQFQFILICNKLPRVDANDGGTWRRIRAIPFEVQFIDSDKKIEHPGKQFYKDENLEEKYELWKAPFIWLLLNKYYPDYRDGKFHEPNKVTQCTKDYQKDSDFFFEFLDEFYEMTKDKKDHVTIEDLCNDFKDYTKEWWPGNSQRPTRKDLLKYLENSGFQRSGTKVGGMRYKLLNGDDGLQGFD